MHVGRCKYALRHARAQSLDQPSLKCIGFRSPDADPAVIALARWVTSWQLMADGCKDDMNYDEYQGLTLEQVSIFSWQCKTLLCSNPLGRRPMWIALIALPAQHCHLLTPRACVVS